MRILKLYFAVLMLLFFASLLCLQENIFSGIEIKEIKRPVSAIYSTKKGNINVKSYCVENESIA